VDKKEKEHEKKRRFMLWVKPSTLQLVEDSLKLDNSGSVSEYIEKAILFYSGYLATNRNENYLPSSHEKRQTAHIKATAVSRLFKSLASIFKENFDKPDGVKSQIDRRQKREIEDKKNAQISQV